ncbi:MAG: DUF3596 domain-containing protein [Hydrogenophaga sp.]|nr:DUF3596 domain-containing protein [Hydrogenophaga sp.]
MSRTGDGVELREKSIRIGFTHGGTYCRETLKIKPTEANRKYAARLVATINNEIVAGVFDYSAHFPDSPRAPKTVNNQLFGDMADLWLKSKGRLALKTRNQYRNAIEVWKTLLGASMPMAKLTHGVVAGKVGSHPWASAKLLNNYLICLRGVFKLAGRELKGMDDPMAGIENSKNQAPAPDPLDQAETQRILDHMQERYDTRVYAYFLFALSTGMRPEEIIALRVEDLIEPKLAHVERARSGGEVGPLKTYQVRDVDLTTPAARAWALALPHAVDGYVFTNPVTRRPWHDERSQRDHYWKPTLQALGIRERRAYQCRHTYATTALMGGANPGYVARQMGHKNTQMLFKIYSRWIDGADRGRELAKIEAAQNTKNQPRTTSIKEAPCE